MFKILILQRYYNLSDDQVEYQINDRIDEICEKGYRNRPLTEVQKSRNKEKSKTRARVEHIFGLMENSMGGMFYKKIGIKRAKTVIDLMNLTYNVLRTS